MKRVVLLLLVSQNITASALPSPVLLLSPESSSEGPSSAVSSPASCERNQPQGVDRIIAGILAEDINDTGKSIVKKQNEYNVLDEKCRTETVIDKKDVKSLTMLKQEIEKFNQDRLKTFSMFLGFLNLK